MTAETQSGSTAEVAAQAAEGLLGPNPFIGLDPADVFATLGKLAREAVRSPMQAVGFRQRSRQTRFLGNLIAQIP